MICPTCTHRVHVRRMRELKVGSSGPSASRGSTGLKPPNRSELSVCWLRLKDTNCAPTNAAMRDSIVVLPVPEEQSVTIGIRSTPTPLKAWSRVYLNHQKSQSSDGIHTGHQRNAWDLIHGHGERGRKATVFGEAYTIEKVANWARRSPSCNGGRATIPRGLSQAMSQPVRPHRLSS